MSDQRQKNQLQMVLGFTDEGRSEAPTARREGTESPTAKRAYESPAIPEQVMEEVCGRENCLRALKRVKSNKGSPGMDGMKVSELPGYLKQHWPAIREQLLRGTYQPRPVRRVEIGKPGGGVRKLGIPTVLDRFIQQAVMQVLQGRWDGTFSEHSHGFRPRRSAHQAVTKAQQYIAEGNRWVVDLDLEKFFDAISHEWLVKFVEHRIADRRVVRLIQKWLNAGVLEDGKRMRVEEGTPQGGSASPLLANIYLHYVFDLWVQTWRRKRAHGDVIVVRYADDIVVGFNSQADADQFRVDLTERMRKFHLELHPEKTRLLEFGPYAIDQRQWRGEGKPETFNFLGFTHICVKKRSNGRFTVLRQTIRKRLQTKLNEVKAELQRRMHEPIPTQGKWLQAVVRGHIRYYGVPMNQPALTMFRFRVGWLWHRSLSRRSQNGRVLWDRMRRLITRWLPLPSVCHPYPLRRLGVIT